MTLEELKRMADQQKPDCPYSMREYCHPDCPQFRMIEDIMWVCNLMPVDEFPE